MKRQILTLESRIIAGVGHCNEGGLKKMCRRFLRVLIRNSRVKIYQNRIMTEMLREKRQEENVKVRTFIQPLIDNQNENRRMYEAVKNINKMRPKQPLVIKSEKGLTTNGEKQTKIFNSMIGRVFVCRIININLIKLPLIFVPVFRLQEDQHSDIIFITKEHNFN